MHNVTILTAATRAEGTRTPHAGARTDRFGGAGRDHVAQFLDRRGIAATDDSGHNHAVRYGTLIFIPVRRPGMQCRARTGQECLARA
ncbi:hypothetical protein [Nocardia sp. NPDC058666]|uniref:hypothetical protein n=1 Tax=Nocardia sp. NPDC058666 TaxID=3346587 RepID=UPI00365E825A